MYPPSHKDTQLLQRRSSVVRVELTSSALATACIPVGPALFSGGWSRIPNSGVRVCGCNYTRMQHYTQFLPLRSRVVRVELTSSALATACIPVGPASLSGGWSRIPNGGVRVCGCNYTRMQHYTQCLQLRFSVVRVELTSSALASACIPVVPTSLSDRWSRILNEWKCSQVQIHTALHLPSFPHTKTLTT